MLGDLVIGAGFNITGITDPEQVERLHFLDSLSLLALAEITSARSLIDIGSGAGFPALALAIALPDARISALDSQRKKCAFVEAAAERLGLSNLVVFCGRAEDYGRAEGREAHDSVVSRAVASLPVLAEYSIPLLRLNGAMVAMKGAISDQERIHGSKALDILGAEGFQEIRMRPFAGAANRWAYVAKKMRQTPHEYPRRAGMPTKRPLGYLGNPSALCCAELRDMAVDGLPAMTIPD